VWYVVSWVGVIPLGSALSLLAFGGGVQMPISRSIRVTCVALEIRRIDVLFVLVFVILALDTLCSTGAFVYCIWRSL